MSFTPDLPEGKTVIHVTNDPIDLNKSYPTQLPIHADAKLFLRQLADELRRRVGDGREAERRDASNTIAAIKANWLSDYEAQFADEREPINAYRMFRELWSLLDPDTTMITHESGASRDIQSVFYESTIPRSYLGWGQSSQLLSLIHI